MDLDFTEEHGILRDMVRALCSEHASLEVVRAFENEGIRAPLVVERAVFHVQGVLSHRPLVSHLHQRAVLAQRAL